MTQNRIVTSSVLLLAVAIALAFTPSSSQARRHRFALRQPLPAVNPLQYYRRGQTEGAIVSRLGRPDRANGNQAIYTLRGTGDGIAADRRLVVLYTQRSDRTVAYDWYVQ